MAAAWTPHMQFSVVVIWVDCGSLSLIDCLDCHIFVVECLLSFCMHLCYCETSLGLSVAGCIFVEFVGLCVAS